MSANFDFVPSLFVSCLILKIVGFDFEKKEYFSDSKFNPNKFPCPVAFS
jgi:hypothetical protein